MARGVTSQRLDLPACWRAYFTPVSGLGYTGQIADTARLPGAACGMQAEVAFCMPQAWLRLSSAPAQRLYAFCRILEEFR
jgi:hypothetical protein